MHLTLWPHQIYYPTPEEYWARDLTMLDGTQCFRHGLFAKGNSAYCVKAQGRQGCHGGMFARTIQKHKNRHTALVC